MKKATIVGLATLVSLGIAAPALAMTMNAPSTSGVHTGKPMHGPAKKTLQGTIKSTSMGSFVLTVRGTDYTVTPTASARVVNRVWKKIVLSDIKTGDEVRAFGVVANASTITAEIVRDISLPIPSHAGSHASTTPMH